MCKTGKCRQQQQEKGAVKAISTVGQKVTCGQKTLLFPLPPPNCLIIKEEKKEEREITVVTSGNSFFLLFLSSFFAFPQNFPRKIKISFCPVAKRLPAHFTYEKSGREMVRKRKDPPGRKEIQKRKTLFPSLSHA